MGQRRTTEFWREVRGLVERGLSLKKASKQFGLAYSHLVQRAKIEGWKLVWRGRPRTLDLPDGTRRVEMARAETERDAHRAELLLEARVAVFDTRKAELVAQKILAQHSTKMKVALSELVVQTALDLRSGEVRPKDRASAMVALKTVCDRLFGWDREPDLQRMKCAGTSYAEDDMPEDFPPAGAVNLGLIATTPEQLAAMAKAKGVFATECNGQGMDPSVIAPEQPSAAVHGSPIPEKEAPKTPLEGQPAQVPTAGRPHGSESINYPAPLSQTPFGQTPQNSFSRPPSWHEHPES